ncbi:MAG: hypothetical protein H6733_06285 [Alphaproteobacteria bacterium]|nr:hypothetical protein [Alphaproteobacteria bacterium]
MTTRPMGALGLAILAAAPAFAADATHRDAHTIEAGAGVLPACKAEPGVAPCKTVTNVLAHGDHRFGRKVMLAWTASGERRGWWADGDVVHATWRVEGALSVGWHKEWDWGDMRLYAGPSVEHVFVAHSTLGTGDLPATVGLDWLDPVPGADGRADRWTDVGVVIGNDIDAPVGPVRLGFRWRIRIGTDVAVDAASDAGRDAAAGVDLWELHALSLSAPFDGPVGVYAELGWTNQITVPFRQPAFRVAPWLLVGFEARWGRT